jgi:hypothetical protein
MLITKDPGFVYAISDTSRDICKIGRARDPEIRTRSIITIAALTDCEIYTSQLVNNYCDCEHLVHERLCAAGYPRKGEWFPCDLDTARRYIDKCVDEINALPLRKSDVAPLRGLMFQIGGKDWAESYVKFCEANKDDEWWVPRRLRKSPYQFTDTVLPKSEVGAILDRGKMSLEQALKDSTEARVTKLEAEIAENDCLFLEVFGTTNRDEIQRLMDFDIERLKNLRFSQFVNTLHGYGIDIDRKQLCLNLVIWGLLGKRGAGTGLPTWKAYSAGILSEVSINLKDKNGNPLTDKDGIQHIKTYPTVTPKGGHYLIKRFLKVRNCEVKPRLNGLFPASPTQVH